MKLIGDIKAWRSSEDAPTFKWEQSSEMARTRKCNLEENLEGAKFFFKNVDRLQQN